MATEIELKNITASYGASPVLQDISLSVGKGEFVALLGASGCGKTTALKIIAGLLTADSGEVWFDGRNISGIPAERRETALVFQKPLLFPFLNVAENVAFGLEMRMVSKKEIAERVSEALSFVQLQGFENRSSKQLSGGQEQRVALARALVTNPHVLLLDEPFSALDAPLRIEMRDLIRQLQQRLGFTTIFVTHDQEEAVSVADRIAFLENGELAQIAEPKDFYLTPKTESVARFFGWKVLQGEINGAYVETSAGSIERELVPRAGSVGTPMAVAFHPDRARLAVASDREGESGNIYLNATLDRVLDLGTKVTATVSFSAGDIIDIDLTGETDLINADLVTLGEQVKIVVPKDAFCLF